MHGVVAIRGRSVSIKGPQFTSKIGPSGPSLTGSMNAIGKMGPGYLKLGGLILRLHMVNSCL